MGTQWIYMIGQALFIACFAPLIAGVIRKTKAILQNRRGPGLLQMYYDLFKLLSKDSVFSSTSSWIFRVAPYIVFMSVMAAAAFVPANVGMGGEFGFADIFVFVYILAIGRFFLTLASLDTGSAFGGMGGAREMFIAVLVEPALLLSMLTVAYQSGLTGLSAMAGTAAGFPFSLPYLFSAIAFFIVAIAEVGRVPVDNPDTHLELTMIHEGMVLEYSGRYLGLIFWASAIKQMVVILLFVLLFLPWNFGITSLPLQGALFIGKILLTALAMAGVETSTNKMRLFKVPGFLAVSCFLSLLALFAQ